MALAVGFLIRMREAQGKRLFCSQSSSRAFLLSSYSISWGLFDSCHLPKVGLWWWASGKKGTIKARQGFERGVLPAILLAPGLWGCCEQVVGTVVVSTPWVKQHRGGLSLFDQPQLVAFLRRLKSEPDPDISICRSLNFKKKKKKIKEKYVIYICVFI